VRDAARGAGGREIIRGKPETHASGVGGARRAKGRKNKSFSGKSMNYPGFWEKPDWPAAGPSPRQAELTDKWTLRAKN